MVVTLNLMSCFMMHGCDSLSITGWIFFHFILKLHAFIHGQCYTNTVCRTLCKTNTNSVINYMKLTEYVHLLRAGRGDGASSLRRQTGYTSSTTTSSPVSPTARPLVGWSSCRVATNSTPSLITLSPEMCLLSSSPIERSSFTLIASKLSLQETVLCGNKPVAISITLHHASGMLCNAIF